MSRSSILILLGVLTMLAPFSGLPGAMRTLLAAILGASVLGIGVAMRSKEQRRLISAMPPPAAPPSEPLVPSEATQSTPSRTILSI